MKPLETVCKYLFVLFIIGFFRVSPIRAENGLRVEMTYITARGQALPSFKNYRYQDLLILYAGDLGCVQKGKSFLNKDTIINLQKFLDSVQCGKIGYRLIFRNAGNQVDSIYQFDETFQLTDKAVSRGDNILSLFVFGRKGEITDQFDLDFGKKYRNVGSDIPTLDQLIRAYEVYTYTDRENFAVSSVWILSIGIDDYGHEKYRNCASDAVSIEEFLRSQYKSKTRSVSDNNIHSYVLLDSQASKKNILEALRDIARRSSFNDYFIFNFSGQSFIFSSDSVNYTTYLFPYNIVGRDKPLLRNPKDSGDVFDHMISLQLLQEFVQQIPAQNQLYISEAGPSEKFKPEFIRALMQSSVEVASLLNKNRIIIVPNHFGWDVTACRDSSIQKGPINYFITSLSGKFNVYDLFGDESRANKIVYHLKQKEYLCQFTEVDYFDIFFERKFLKEYREMLGPENATRSLNKSSSQIKKELQELTGRRYALLIGTDQYRAEEWKDLANPVKDVNAVAAVLRDLYGFEVQLLENQPIDTIFSTIGSYYRKVQPNDQVVIYFAGHGDVDEELLSDGFIVCTDSRPPEQDIARNSYISYLKLQKMINNLSARQVLVMLDVCHGGVFDQKAFDKMKRDNPVTSHIANRNVLELLKDKLPLRTRKFLSSVGSESAFDGYAGRHSPFVNQLLQILTSQAKDANGIVLLSDIYSVLLKSSLNETATLKISPYMADFGNVDAFTEFIFMPASGN